jgi:hypothetical protein
LLSSKVTPDGAEAAGAAGATLRQAGGIPHRTQQDEISPDSLFASHRPAVVLTHHSVKGRINAIAKVEILIFYNILG